MLKLLKKTKAKFMCIIIVMMLAFAPPTLADWRDFPPAFWNYHNAYLDAVSTNNYNEIIRLGNLLSGTFEGFPLNVIRIDNRRTIHSEIARAYEALGRYVEAIPHLQIHSYYSALAGANDAVIIANRRIELYTPVFELYRKTMDQRVNFGAMHEHSRGVKYGFTSDSGVRSNLPGESVILTYIEFGCAEIFGTTRVSLNDARANGLYVLVGLNVPYEVRQIRNIANGAYAQFMAQLVQLLNEYQDVPIFLRFGAEMNTWYNAWERYGVTPDDYIAAFRYVANYIRRYCPHVAMVWSPDATSPFAVDVNKFYPGDDYVDWVGVSLYAQRFKGGRITPHNERHDDWIFFIGDSWCPVIQMREIIELYGDRKPIMITESGVGHFVRGSLNRSETAWAEIALQKMYVYLPMVFPQIKMIVYFDVYRPLEYTDFRITGHSTLPDMYRSLVSSSAFVQANNTRGVHTFRHMENAFSVGRETVEFFGYAHVFRQDVPLVVFSLNGIEVARSSTVGYNVAIDFSRFNVGETVVLTVNVSDGLFIRNYYVTIEDEIKLILHGQRVVTEVPPVIMGIGFTMVPVRIISDLVGADVGWNDALRQVTIGKNGTTLILTIDSSIALVNGIEEELTHPPVLEGGRTLVPVAWIARQFGLQVEWDDSDITARTVSLFYSHLN